MSNERLYRIRVVAEMVGITENLIRAWERRYSIVEPLRGDSGYRAYTEFDIEVLRRVKQLTREGMSIGDIAPLVPSIKRELKNQATRPSIAGDVKIDADRTTIDKWLREIVLAAESMNQQRVSQVLDRSLATLPPLEVFDQLMMPVLVEVGERWHAGTLTIAQEHLVSHAIRQRLLSLILGAPQESRRHVLCACFPEEDHELGLLGAALRFRHAGFRVTYLGPRTPAAEIGLVAETLRPDLVALSSTSCPSRSQFRSTLKSIHAALPAKQRLVVGGANAETHSDVVIEFGASIATAETWNWILA